MYSVFVPAIATGLLLLQMMLVMLTVRMVLRLMVMMMLLMMALVLDCAFTTETGIGVVKVLLSTRCTGG